MADTGVTINVRERGSRQAARGVEKTAKELEKLGRSGKVAATGLRASSGAARGLSGATRGLAGGLGRVGGTAAYAGAALTGGLVVGLKRSYDAFDESRQIAADTRAVIKSTGGVANVTADDIDKLSGALSRKNAVDDETIQQGANVLATFTNVRNEVGKGNNVFDRASQAAVDLSARLGTDVKGGFLQVGKALNDPTKGVTALRRAGVSFTKQQIEQIKKLQESGDLLGAQRIVLRELDKEFAGSAKAQATPLKRLKISWGNLEETIGKGVAPAVDSVATEVDRFVRRAMPKVEAFSDVIGSIFNNKDMTLGEKLKLSGAEVRDVFTPLSDELKRELGDANLGPKIGRAVENAIPDVLEAMGKAAGAGAVAFGRGFLKADPVGQAFALMLVAGKLGLLTKGFSALGGAAWGKFLSGWKTRAGKSPLPAPTPTPTPTGGPGTGTPVVAPVKKPGKLDKLKKIGKTGAKIAVPIGAAITIDEVIGQDNLGVKAREVAEKAREKARRQRKERLPVPTGLDVFGGVRVPGARTSSRNVMARPATSPRQRPRAVQPSRRREKERPQTIIFKVGERELKRVVVDQVDRERARR
jgi:hypothetical protein